MRWTEGGGSLARVSELPIADNVRQVNAESSRRAESAGKCRVNWFYELISCTVHLSIALVPVVY